MENIVEFFNICVTLAEYFLPLFLLLLITFINSNYAMTPFYWFKPFIEFLFSDKNSNEHQSFQYVEIDFLSSIKSYSNGTLYFWRYS